MRLTWRDARRVRARRPTVRSSTCTAATSLTPDLLDEEAGVAGEYDGAIHLEDGPRRRDLDREALYRDHRPRAGHHDVGTQRRRRQLPRPAPRRLPPGRRAAGRTPHLDDRAARLVGRHLHRRPPPGQLTDRPARRLAAPAGRPDAVVPGIRAVESGRSTTRMPGAMGHRPRIGCGHVGRSRARPGPGGRLRCPVRPADRPAGARGQRLLRDRARTRCRSPRCSPASRRRSCSPAAPPACTPRARPASTRRSSRPAYPSSACATASS